MCGKVWQFPQNKAVSVFIVSVYNWVTRMLHATWQLYTSVIILFVVPDTELKPPATKHILEELRRA